MDDHRDSDSEGRRAARGLTRAATWALALALISLPVRGPAPTFASATPTLVLLAALLVAGAAVARSR